jgi:hypothetical protein
VCKTMNQSDPEFLLRELARIEETDGEEPVPVELLAAYRSGTLSSAETERLERRLAASPGARQRLAAAGGVALAGPDERVRRAVLAPAATGSRPDVPRRRRRFAVRAVAAAAMLALAIGLAWRSQLPHSPGEPPLPAFEITLSGGLASDRATIVTGAAITAEPHSRVTLVFRPRQAVAGLEFGLYRENGGRLERLRPGGAIRQVLGRGAAEWTARAADLVGDAPGEHPLWAVVARQGDLPDGTDVALGHGPEKGLAAGGRRAVQTLRITLRPPGGARGEMP